MHCPFCFAVDTKVIDSSRGRGFIRYAAVGSVWCNERFTTFEVAELVMPRVVKATTCVNRLMKRNYVAECCGRWKTSGEFR